jgi:hypothetical protein
VFNKTYQLRAVRSAGCGHELATKALLRLPEPWRPLVTVAAIAGEFYRPKHRPQPRPPRPGQKPVARFEQLELFPAGPQTICKSRPDPDRPLFDLFPEAYT